MEHVYANHLIEVEQSGQFDNDSKAARRAAEKVAIYNKQLDRAHLNFNMIIITIKNIHYLMQ